MRSLVSLLLVLASSAAQASAEIAVCYNYGCLSEARVSFADDKLASLAAQIASAPDAASERERIARAVGELYVEAGRQSPIKSDRAGDYLDEGVYGKMDCIDHATSTTRMLALLESRGMFRFHRVVAQARRTRFVIFQHFSAVLEERLPSSTEGPSDAAPRFVVDSWFVEHGEPAVILPLNAWLDGEGPNVQ